MHGKEFAYALKPHIDVVCAAIEGLVLRSSSNWIYTGRIVGIVGFLDFCPRLCLDPIFFFSRQF